MPQYTIRPLETEDQTMVEELLEEHWGGTAMALDGHLFPLLAYPGFAAESAEGVLGFVLYAAAGRRWEIMVLQALLPRQGVGTALLSKVTAEAFAAGAEKLSLVTTNDNLDALRFYQRRNFQLVAVRKDAVARSRAIKPSIPERGLYGIPLRDELVLEYMLLHR